MSQSATLTECITDCGWLATQDTKTEQLDAVRDHEWTQHGVIAD